MAKTNSNLTDKQERFCQEYLIDLNATQAAIRAGYSEKTANEQACRLLANVSVSEYIEAKRERISKKLDISQERVMEEYARLAFFDIRKCFNVEGRMLAIHELDDDTARALSGVETYEETSAVGDETFKKGETKKIKVWDKRAALDSICKVLGYNAPEKVQATVQQITGMVVK